MNNIVRREAEDQDFGFDATRWQNGQESVLLLEDRAEDPVADIRNLFSENAPIERSIDLNDLIDPVADIRNLFSENAPTEPLPDTIIVTTGESTASRMEVKGVVLDLLQQARTEAREYVLKETDPTSPANGQVAVTFAVRRRTILAPISTVAQFIENMGEKPKSNILFVKQSQHYKDILDALEQFHKRLAEIDRTTHRVESLLENDPLRQELIQLATKLQNSIKAYGNESSTGIFQTDKTAKEKKKAVVASLGERVQAAMDEGFHSELDRLREGRWRQLFALREDHIIPGTSRVLGSGAQGEVRAYHFQLGNDREFNAAVKYDDNNLNMEALGAGISRENPQQSARAVAAYALSRRLELDIIPETRFMIGTDDAGRPRLGQALAVVEGVVGQRKVSTDQPPGHSVEDLNYYRQVLMNPTKYDPTEFDAAESAMRDHEFKNEKWSRVEIRPVAIPYDDPIVQKGLSDLQLFDYIIGHADRNPGNWIFEGDHNNIRGVKGIDNDDTFGQGWKSLNSTDFGWRSKTPDVPPIVDAQTALKILRIDPPETIRADLTRLSQTEQDQAVARLITVQTVLKQRINTGDIANLDKLTAAEKTDLAKFAGIAAGALPANKPWGPVTFAAHNPNNSYLGYVHNKGTTGGFAPVSNG